MKREGLIVISLGLVCFAVVITLAYTNFYIGRIYHTFWPTIWPYIFELKIPFAIAALVTLTGVVMLVQKK